MTTLAPNTPPPRALIPALFAVPAAAFILAPFLPPPAQMLTLALALYFACKLLTAQVGPALPPRRTFAYLFLWIGMTPAPFAHPGLPRPWPARRLLWTFAKMTFALALLPLAPRHLPPLLAGYAALFALVLFFHFGLFELLAFFWQTRGVAVQPLMVHPLRATSLADFWNRRWNLAFHTLATRFLFRPLARRLAPIPASLATFAISGLIHELVITIPARGGFGSPTLFFLLQALGLHLQRTTTARRLRVDRGLLGWFYTAAFTLGLVWLLFPPAFIHRVILPLVAGL